MTAAKMPRPATLTERAAGVARMRHERCDDLAADSIKTDDGEQVVYCENCGEVLLRWGGS
jgi:hypothetical protein